VRAPQALVRVRVHSVCPLTFLFFIPRNRESVCVGHRTMMFAAMADPYNPCCLDCNMEHPKFNPNRNRPIILSGNSLASLK
jgi:hypothetical protein